MDTTPLTARNGPYDKKRLGSVRDFVGQRRVWRFMRKILLAREESHERTALLRHVITDGPAQRRIPSLERIEDRALRRLTLDLEVYLAVDMRQSP